MAVGKVRMLKEKTIITHIAFFQNASFGWQSDGLRGHIYATDDNSLVVVSIKGTSAGLWTGGPTGEKDKINVSLLSWRVACDLTTLSV